ncbi:Ig-like domain-containing protein [Clostridium sp. MSJ-4]|uniref:Ig-like domain-containing protein n=1 Tax=Clostridium simiarum TaxID=2841506 RepID=A0ABS6F1V9_9CLOT|nr:transglutaminase domain-containing protein [Clostridium simiarum]MBU5592499.1 Ig-like domain-containing protein [Clostridium simiarum]
MKKSIISIFSATTIIFSLFTPITTKALENNKAIPDSNYSDNVDNPIFSDTHMYWKSKSSPSLNTYEDFNSKKSVGTVSNLKDLNDLIIDQCRNLKENFLITYTGKLEDLNTLSPRDIMDYIEHEDHYIFLGLGVVNFSFEGHDGNIDVTVTASYRTSRAKEDYIDKKIDSILKDIIKDDMDIEEKAMAIHDYIVKNIKYDRTLEKMYAYEALYYGTTICIGYAGLAYKMLNKVGIENKIVSGRGFSGTSSGKHAWNLVNIRGNWYHLDCTGDSPSAFVAGRVLYTYYNLTDDEILKDHEFPREKYPASSTEKYSRKIYTRNYKVIDSKKDVPLNKDWNIKFSKDPTPSTITKSNIYVIKGDSYDPSDNIPAELPFNNAIDVTVDYNDINKTAFITNDSNWEPQSTYYIVVTSNIISEKGVSLWRPVIMKFSTL